jgi:chromosome segregation ATPase
MSLKRLKVSIEQEIPVLQDEIRRVSEERESLMEEAREVQNQISTLDYGDKRDRAEEHFTTMKRQWNALEGERLGLEHRLERFEEYVDEWESTEFVVRELTFGEIQKVKDVVSSESFSVDVQLQEIEGTPLQGLYQNEILRRSVEETPEDAPDDVLDLPDVLGEWLFEKSDEVNSVGEQSMGNLSLEEAISSDS